MLRFVLETDLIAGNGRFRQLPAFLREKCYRRPGCLVDAGFAASALWRRVEEDLKEVCGPALRLHLRSDAAEPTYDSLRATLQLFRGVEHDVIVGIGGGSCMDTAKAVAALLTNPGDPLQYRGFDKLQRPGLPVVLVPTTAGTGSEASCNASFVDTVARRKLGINGRHMFARHAILDGETTLSCPYQAALGAAVDALVHTLEGFVSKRWTVLSDMLAKQAFVLLVNAMPALKNDPQNLDRRLELLLGAYLGGIVQMNSGSGVAAALSYPLSVYYQVPHGIGGGLFCLEVIRFNIDAGFYRYAELAPLLEVGCAGGGDRENALAVHARLAELWDFLGVPKTLRAFGISSDQFGRVLDIMKTQQPGFDQNPVPFTVDEHLPRFLEAFF